MARPTWDQVMETATQPGKNWSNKNIARFHYFNPNGLFEQWRAMTNTIGDYVKYGSIFSGWNLVYGNFDDTYIKELIDLAVDRKRVSAIDLNVCIKGIERKIKRGYNELAEKLSADLPQLLNYRYASNINWGERYNREDGMHHIEAYDFNHARTLINEFTESHAIQVMTPDGWQYVDKVSTELGGYGNA